MRKEGRTVQDGQEGGCLRLLDPFGRCPSLFHFLFRNSFLDPRSWLSRRRQLGRQCQRRTRQCRRRSQRPRSGRWRDEAHRHQRQRPGRAQCRPPRSPRRCSDCLRSSSRWRCASSERRCSRTGARGGRLRRLQTGWLRQADAPSTTSGAGSPMKLPTTPSMLDSLFNG